MWRAVLSGCSLPSAARQRHYASGELSPDADTGSLSTRYTCYPPRGDPLAPPTVRDQPQLDGKPYEWQFATITLRSWMGRTVFTLPCWPGPALPKILDSVHGLERWCPYGRDREQLAAIRHSGHEVLHTRNCNGALRRAYPGWVVRSLDMSRVRRLTRSRQPGPGPGGRAPWSVHPDVITTANFSTIICHPRQLAEFEK